MKRIGGPSGSGGRASAGGTGSFGSTGVSIRGRITRGGDRAVTVKCNSTGEIRDISPRRVKGEVPNPRAPNGRGKAKFDNFQPGTKGRKRDPTPEDLKFIDDFFRIEDFLRNGF